MQSREQGECSVCMGPINVGDEVTWARRGPMQGKPYHVTCKPTANPAPFAGDSLAEALARSIEPFLNNQRDELTAELEARIAEMLEARIAEIQQPTKTVYIQSGRTLGTTDSPKHEHFDLLCQLVAARINVYLWGDAGSGKSSAAHQISKILDLPFYYLALQAQTPESRLMGYMDANGNYVETDFYRAYVNGGVFLLDELELGNGNLLGSLNGALANGRASFPCGIVERHPDFICIATGNTPGLGATKAYSDRRALDGSVRDRFMYIEWNTDAALELALAARHFDRAEIWVNWVQAIRSAARSISPALMVTQRASIEGSKLLAMGLEVARVAEGMVFRGFDRNSIEALLARNPLPVF